MTDAQFVAALRISDDISKLLAADRIEALAARLADLHAAFGVASGTDPIAVMREAIRSASDAATIAGYPEGMFLADVIRQQAARLAALEAERERLAQAEQQIAELKRGKCAAAWDKLEAERDFERGTRKGAELALDAALARAEQLEAERDRFKTEVVEWIATGESVAVVVQTLKTRISALEAGLREVLDGWMKRLINAPQATVDPVGELAAHARLRALLRAPKETT